MSKTFDQKELRNVAGAFATGITVITTYKANNEIHGMTANSFLSLSLDPALVSFSVKKSGSLMQHLTKGKKVAISILSQEQIDISNQFAGQNKTPINIQYDEHENGVATIKECMAWYNTSIADIIPAGDHYLILCQIEDLYRNEEKKPLIYFSGYKTLS